ncbi:MAG: sorting protein [Planctomycetota bacterium]|nr:sorting protein [Planctomycetota bacterium]
MPFGSDVYAGYQLSPGYDSSLSAELGFGVRTTTTSAGFELEIGFSDTNASAYLVVGPAGWSLYGSGYNGTFADPSAFHAFRLTTAGVTHAFVLRIDEAVVAAGILPGGFAGPSAVFFGDGTPTGGNVQGDISYIRYSNPARAVPEPSSLALAGLGGLTLAGFAWRRRRAA